MQRKNEHLAERDVLRRDFISTTARMATSAIALAACGGAPTIAAAAGQSMTPEVRLVDDYNAWFIAGGAYKGDLDVMKAGLPRYITDQTVLHEAASLPWGGTMVGYDGWVRLCRISAPIWGVIAPHMVMSDQHYYQRGNVVLHELTVTVLPTDAAPEPFTMGILEKYTIANGRIRQIDEFYSDTSEFLKLLGRVGALPPHTS